MRTANLKEERRSRATRYCTKEVYAKARTAKTGTEPRRLAFVITSKLLPPHQTIPQTYNHLSTFFTSSKLTMAFESGLAFDLVSASVLGPAPIGQPTSQGGPQAEFHVTRSH